MEISRDLASSIIKEIKEIIGKDMNFIDSQGIIVASTDEKRVGTFHAGGVEAIKKDGIVVIDWEEQYKGAKKGINIPIKFLGEPIGVIGISGDIDEVGKYGQIIKRMSEILVKESYFLRKRDEEEEYDRYIIETLLFSENSYEIEKVREKFKKQSRVIILKILAVQEREKIREVFRDIRERVKFLDVFTLLKEEYIIILSENSNRERIEKIFITLDKLIKEYRIKIGVGEDKKIEDIRESYSEGKKALEWSEKIDSSKVYYEDMLLEIIINSIKLEDGKRYKSRVLKDLTPKELDEYLKIISLYEKYNGSLSKISSELYCHSNTLQYKLNKFYEKTGYDIRKYRDFVVIKIAFLL